MLDYLKRFGDGYHTIDAIVGHTGLSTGKVRYGILELEGNGMVRVTRKRGAGNHYEVVK